MARRSGLIDELLDIAIVGGILYAGARYACGQGMLPSDVCAMLPRLPGEQPAPLTAPSHRVIQGAPQGRAQAPW